MGSEVAEDLLFLAPVHRGCSFPVAAAQDLLLSLGSCWAKTQTAVHKRVWNMTVILIRDLQYTQTLSLITLSFSDRIVDLAHHFCVGSDSYRSR